MIILGFKFYLVFDTRFYVGLIVIGHILIIFTILKGRENANNIFNRIQYQFALDSGFRHLVKRTI